MQEQPFLMQIRNTSNVTLDVLLTQINSNVSNSYTQANTAYAAANTAESNALEGITIGEFAYTQANNAYSTANVAYGTAATAYNQANAAYAQANNAYNYAQLADSDAIQAYSQATAAYNQANNAYATANAAIASSGVTAGSYGSGIAIPVVTFDARGRATYATTTALATFTATSKGVVPASGGVANTYLNSSGSFTAPAFVVQESIGANGYRKYSDGYIEMWGRFTTTGSNQTAVSFSTITGISFPNACFICDVNANGGIGAFYQVGYPSKTGFTVVTGGSGIPMTFFANGY